MSASAVSKSKPGFANIHEHGDYPIILGDSMKDGNRSQSNFMQVRYNWEPKNGFQRQKGALKQNNSNLHLTYQDGGSSLPTYSYDGHVTTSSNSKEDKDMSRLVLIFDESRSAFVLERITTSIDMNVTSAPNQTKDDIKRHRQLRKASSEENVNGINGANGAHSEEEGEADSSNPYDFRHFLAEAKENAEKGTHAGNRTPIPGGGTPISRVASPSLGAGRFANTPSYRPPPTSAPIRKPAENGFKSSATTATKKPTPPKRRDATSLKQPSKAPPKARRSDSDGEASDTITVNPPPKGHTKNTPSTSSYDRSPRITVNDLDDELEVDMGIPAPPTRRPRGGINPDLFRSRPHTPVQATKNKPPPARPRDTDNDIIMPDADSEESDTQHQDENTDSDRDVDDLNLNSPQAKKNESHSHPAEQNISVPTPPIQTQDSQDADEDENLMALFNAALEEDEEEEHADRKMGANGADVYGHVPDDDESEISEEE